MVRVQRRSLLRHQSARRRRRHERAERRAPVHARRRGRRRSITRRCSSPNLLNEARFALPERRSRSRSGRRRRSRPPTRAPGRCRSRSASRASSDLFSHQVQFSDTLSWSRGKHYLRFGGSVVHHTSGGTGSEPGTAVARHVHVPQHDDGAVRSADAGRRAELHAADQLRHQQLRAEAVALRRVRAGQHPRAPTTSRSTLGLRYDRQTLTDATNELRAARRLRLASERRCAHCRFAAATGCTTRRSAPTRSPATW